jgi:hypothetical protein
MANSGGWYIFLFLFILGVTAQSFNQMGIFSVSQPVNAYSVSTDQLMQLQNNSVNNSPLSIFVIYSWVIAFMTIIGAGILSVISFGSLMYLMGWPVGIVGAACIQLIQLPATMIMLFWLFELWTGR